MDLEPEVVRLEGGGRDADGSQAEGMAAADGRRYPPCMDMVGTICRFG